MGKKDPTRRHDVLSDAAVNNITRQTRKLVEKTVRDIAISALDEVVKEYLSDAIDAAAVDAARAAAARVAPEIVFNAVIQLLSQTEDNNPHKVPQLLPFIDMASPTHRQLPLVRACLQADIPVWLHGEAGSGKSTMSEQVAQQLGLPYRSKSLGPATLEAGLLGFVDANGHYHTTGLREVYEATRANGDEGEGGVFLFDEIDNANSSVLTALNSIIGGDHGEFPDGRIERHQNTRFIAAANTIGRGATAQYVGRAPIDTATIDRFAFVQVDIDKDLEEYMVTGEMPKKQFFDLALGGVPDMLEWYGRVTDFRKAVDEVGLRTLISQRATLYGGKLLETCEIGITHLENLLIYKGMSEQDRSRLTEKMEVA